jgi:hypothetical protein
MWQWQGGAAGGWRLDAYGDRSWQVAALHEGAPVEPLRDSEPLRSETDTTQSGPRSGRARDVVPESTARVRGGREPTPIFQAIASEWERHRRDDVARDDVRDVSGHRRGSAPAGEWDHGGVVPAPRAGTGPLPVQRPPAASGTRDLLAVPAVPPPPPPPPHGVRRDDVVGHRPGVAPSGERDQAGWVPAPRSGSGPLSPQRPLDASRRDLVPGGVVPPPPPRSGPIEDELTRRAQRRRRPLATSPPEGGRHAVRPRDGDEPTVREDLNTLGAVADVLTFSGRT